VFGILKSLFAVEEQEYIPENSAAYNWLMEADGSDFLETECKPGFSKTLFVCECPSEDLSEQFVRLQFYGAEPQATKMVLSGDLRFGPRAADWMKLNFDVDERINRYGCDPLRDFSPDVLPSLSNEAFLLFHYLCGLGRKKFYTCENTPKRIKERINRGRLAAAYEELVDKELLSEVEIGRYVHSEFNLAVNCRAVVRAASSVARFLITCEGTTRRYQAQMFSAMKHGLVFYLDRCSDRRSLVCPACSYYSDDQQIVEANRVVMVPFHYSCGFVYDSPNVLSFVGGHLQGLLSRDCAEEMLKQIAVP
jgi:hypothetical protein